MKTPAVLLFTLVLWAIGSVSLLISCNEDPVGGEIKIFELEIMASYSTDERDNWVIISNAQGEFVASAPFESGQIVELSADSRKVQRQITVTLVTYIPASVAVSARDFYYFNSYTNIETGDKWFLKRPPSLPQEDAGNVTLNISNLPSGEQELTVSSLYRRNGVSASWSGSSANLEVNLRKSPADLFVSVIGNDPRYVRIDTAVAGQVLDLDFTTDFSPFDHVFPVTFSSFNFFGTIQGFSSSLDTTETTNNYFHDQTFYAGSTDQLKVGFNDGYSFYVTNWSATFADDSRAGYYKLGAAPVEGSFRLFNADFTILNSDFNSIRFTANPGFVYCFNEWISVDDISADFPIITWQMAQPVNSQTPVLKSIPEEIINQYPYLEAIFNRIAYRGSTFVLNISGTTYENFINDQLGTESFQLKPREWFSVSR